MDGAAAHATDQAAACRALAARINVLVDVSDQDVRAGATDLTDVCADVLELVAIDLELIAARMRSAAALYSAVESAALAAFPGQRP